MKKLIAALATVLVVAGAAGAEKKSEPKASPEIEALQKERDEALAARDQALEAAGQCRQGMLALSLKLTQLSAAAGSAATGQ
jgi:hypothetical protein